MHRKENKETYGECRTDEIHPSPEDLRNRGAAQPQPVRLDT